MTKLYLKKNFNNKNILEKSKVLLNETNKVFNSRDFKKYFKDLSNYLSIPEKEIIFYFKKQYFNSFDFRKNIFRKKIFLSSIFKFIFIYVFFLISIFIFKKKNQTNPKIKSDILIDDVSDINEIKRYDSLKKLFKSHIVRLNKDLSIKKSSKQIIFRKKFMNYYLSVNDLFFLLKMFNKNFKYSFKTKLNLFYFFLKFIDDYFYYSSFFKEYKFEYLISSRHYVTNNIKNFFAKKNNTHCSVLQKNIDTENLNGFFIDTDTLFVLGKKTKIKNKIFNRINKQVEVGSFFMENLFFKKKRYRKNFKNLDILCLGGNEQYPGSEHDNYKDHSSNYTEHLNWLIKIAKEFPHLKIGFLHHANNRNDFEENFFKGSNVIYVSKETNSYILSAESKFLCSWASTMIVELFSLKKRGFYLDPNYKNVQFMNNINKNIRINTYNIFKKIFFNKILRKIDFNNYCVKSNNTSYKIFKYLKNK